jgi:hypothetical protein
MNKAMSTRTETTTSMGEQMARKRNGARNDHHGDLQLAGIFRSVDPFRKMVMELLPPPDLASLAVTIGYIFSEAEKVAYLDPIREIFMDIRTLATLGEKGFMVLMLGTPAPPITTTLVLGTTVRAIVIVVIPAVWPKPSVEGVVEVIVDAMRDVDSTDIKPARYSRYVSSSITGMPMAKVVFANGSTIVVRVVSETIITTGAMTGTAFTSMRMPVIPGMDSEVPMETVTERLTIRNLDQGRTIPVPLDIKLDWNAEPSGIMDLNVPEPRSPIVVMSGPGSGPLLGHLATVVGMYTAWIRSATRRSLRRCTATP